MDPAGSLVGTLSTDRLRFLANNFMGTDLACQLAQLLYRYQCTYQATVRSTLRNHWQIPPQLYQCFATYFPISTEWFASPLNVSGVFPHYCTPFAADSIFRANFDAFASQWTGFSVANPEYDSITIDRAVRWAILSAAHNMSPVATFFFLPDWSFKTYTTYLHWFRDAPFFCRPFLRLPSRAFKFQTPEAWTGWGTTFHTHPKWPLYIFVVANGPAFRIIDDVLLQRRFDFLEHFLAVLSDLKLSSLPLNLKTCLQTWWRYRPGPLSPDSVPVPLSFRKLPTSPLIPLLSTPPPLLESFLTAPPPLLYSWSHFTYTDGSVVDPTDSPCNGIGAAVYIPGHNSPATVIQHVVSGSSTYRTINRAELLAIYLAVRHGSYTILTDSATCMYQLHRMLHYPTAFKEHRHNNLIASILRLLLQRNVKLHLYKVNSHTAVLGNDLADQLAREVATTPPASCPPHWSSSVPPSNLREGLFLPYILDSSVDRHLTSSSSSSPPTAPFQLASLTRDLRDYFLEHDRFGYANIYSRFYSAWRHLDTILAPCSHHFLSDSSLPSSVRSLTLQARFGVLDHTRLTCPTCAKPLSTAHVLTGCTCLARLYTTRHNQAVLILLHALLAGTHGGAIVQADLSASVDDELRTQHLPRLIPKRVLTSSQTSLPSRPDITFYYPPTPSRKGSIYLVELKYSMETALDASFTKAHSQHKDTLTLLRHLRPDCDVRLVPVHLGATGGIYTHLSLDSLVFLGLHDSLLKHTTQKLHRHAVLWLYSLLTKYQNVRYRPATGRLTRTKRFQTSGVT